MGKGVILTIEPGVEMRFLPGVGISVNGTLIAKVSYHVEYFKDDF